MFHDDEGIGYTSDAEKACNEVCAELTTLRAQVAGLEERVRLLNAECMAWRQGDGDNYRCGCGCDRCVRLRAVRAASDAASAVRASMTPLESFTRLAVEHKENSDAR